jgi:hypothetical protein
MTAKRRPNPEAKALPKKIGLNIPVNSVPRTESSKAICVYVTPSLAKQWLSLNTENRPGSTINEKKIQRAIHHGLWKVNGETIKFDVNGILRDGQTRLNAIVKEGRSVWSWVIYDIENDSFDSIDRIRVRSLGHILSIHGYKNYNPLAQALKIAYELDNAIPECPGGFTELIGLDLLQKNPAIMDSVNNMVKNCIRENYSIGCAAALHFLMCKTSKEKADEYWEQLSSGIINNKRSPARIVRDTLVRNKNARKDDKLSPTSLMAIIIKGWNISLDGKQRSIIRWNSETEAFPTIE